MKFKIVYFVEENKLPNYAFEDKIKRMFKKAGYEWYATGSNFIKNEREICFEIEGQLPTGYKPVACK